MYAALVKYTLVLLCLLVCTRGVIYFILGWMVVVLQTVRCLVKVWQLHCRYTYILHIYSCKIYLLSGIVHVRWDGLVCHACIPQLDKIHPMFICLLFLLRQAGECCLYRDDFTHCFVKKQSYGDIKASQPINFTINFTKCETSAKWDTQPGQLSPVWTIINSSLSFYEIWTRQLWFI